MICLAIAAGALGFLVSPAKVASSDFYAPAITNNGQGALVKFRATLIPGTGKTLVNIQNAQYREDTENALRKAKKNAEDYLGIRFAFYDVILDVEGIGSEVGGESAGAMFTIGIISAYTGKKIDASATMSAGVTESGKLFAVDSIEEKIIAAKNSGKKKFIVAATQNIKNPDFTEGVEIIKAIDVKEAVKNLLN